MSRLIHSSQLSRLSLCAVLADLAELAHAAGSARPANAKLRAVVQEALREGTYVVPRRLPTRSESNAAERIDALSV